jgi:hypothetical protein
LFICMWILAFMGGICLLQLLDRILLSATGSLREYSFLDTSSVSLLLLHSVDPLVSITVQHYLEIHQ